MSLIFNIIRWYRNLGGNNYNLPKKAEPSVRPEIDVIPAKKESAPSDENVLKAWNPKQYPNLVVCLDNGHGSNTPGKCSPYSAYGIQPELPFREYQFSREIVDILKKKLELHGIEVYVVVPEDTDISLKTRYKRINNRKLEDPDKKYLMISVHANAAGNGTSWLNARGWSAYTTKGQNNSDKLAECLYDAAEEILIPMGQKIRYDRSDGDKDWEANFTIIYGSNMPSVLTENMFQDNIEDVKFLLSPEGKEAIAEVHRKGILKFAEQMWNM